MKEVDTLSPVERALLIAKWEIFERLATDEVAMIAVRTGEVEYEAGEVIDPDGPMGSCLHLILRGSVQLSYSTSTPTDRSFEAQSGLRPEKWTS